MANVYVGTDTLLRRRVAIKVLREQYASDDDFVKRFSYEAQSAAKLSHPNIVSVYDFGTRGPLVLHRHGARRRRDAGRSHAPGARAAGAGRARLRDPGRERLGVRAPPRAAAPRRQAGEHLGHQRRRREAERFRHRARRVGAHARRDAARDGDGQRRVHLARAGAGPRHRRAQRPLLRRRRALSDAHRRAAVHRRQRGRGRAQARLRRRARDRSEGRGRRARRSRRSSHGCCARTRASDSRRPPSLRARCARRANGPT